MRTVPESIKLALQDPSLPIQKRILLYRRVWDVQGAKYTLETTPVDVTGLLVEAGSIKMALDTDEVDKWDASNVTLTFHNDLNCFKEGLKGGLFEQAVLWGSKFVYNIENAGLQAPQGSITVFTGYVYSSPVFRENGNQIELTITSSLDALEYVSAEDFCLSAADELATEVEAENEDDQGKEFTTVQTGVGYVDSVKYGADLTSALTLVAGTDYEVSDTNEYSLPAKISLKFTPTAGYKMWVSYRYWHKDMKIEDIVNALLDLAGIERRLVDIAKFETNAKAYIEDIQSKNYNLFCDFDDDGIIVPEFPIQQDGYDISHKMDFSFSMSKASSTNKTMRCRLPSFGYFNVACLGTRFFHAVSGAEGLVSFNADNGNSIRVYYKKPGDDSRMHCYFQIVHNSQTDTLFFAYNADIVGFNLQNGYADIFYRGTHNTGAVTTQAISKTRVKCEISGVFTEIYFFAKAPNLYPGWFHRRIAWREDVILDEEWEGKEFPDMFDFVFSRNSFMLCEQPEMRIEVEKPIIAEGWDRFSYSKSLVNNGSGEWLLSYSDDSESWSEKQKIENGSDISFAARYLRLYLIITSYPGYITAEHILLSYFLSYSVIPLVNLTGLTVGEAIAQLAKMVSYEIGFNQDGVFFFRSRQGRYADAEIDSSSLIDVDNHGADIDNLANRVSVEFGAFKTTVDDFTEGKPRPNTIDTYGVHEKSISSDNFIPADNVDISAAVAKANYEALSTPGYTVQLDCRPDLSLELGDKITVSSENTQIADKNWSDYSKFLKLPIWKRVFKITGLELSFAKRLMSLTLKDVTSAADVPNQEYNVYQTQFPTPLDYKE